MPIFGKEKNMFIYTIKDVVFMIFLIVDLLLLLGLWVYSCYIGWREKRANKYSDYCLEWYLETFDDATKEDAERFAKKCYELKTV